jgi:hypothetical protein
MSDKIFKEIRSTVVRAGLKVCWAQWSALGSYGSSERTKRPISIIDPEALILLSLGLEKEERRLGDMLFWWASAGSRLTSVQRIRTLVKDFPDGVQQSIWRYASLAAAAGDRRWKGLATEEAPRPRGRGLKGPDTLDLGEASTLMLRLRAAFGVGSKADALTFLLGIGGSWASVSVISEATGYSRTAIRSAVRDMALGRLICETEDRPARYFVPTTPWTELLEMRRHGSPHRDEMAMPPWRFWSDIFGFLLKVADWAERAIESEGAVDVVASRARDIVLDSAHTFDLNGIPVPDSRRYRGPEFLFGLRDTVRVLSDWLEEEV